MINRLKTPAAMGLLILFFLGQSAYLAKTNSTVSDEIAHIVAGYSYLKYGTLKLNPEHPPFVKQIAALPLLFMDLKFPQGDPAWKEGEQWALGRAFLYALGNPAEKMIFWSRISPLPIAILLALSIFSWTKELFGNRAALFSLFLFSLLPQMVIDSSLVTTDFASTTFFFTTLYFLYRYSKAQVSRDAYLAGLAGGLALISKYSAMLVIPLFYLFVFWFYFSLRKEEKQSTCPLWALALITVLVSFHRLSFFIFALPLLYHWGAVIFPKHALFQNVPLRSAMTTLLILLTFAFLVVAVSYFEPDLWMVKFRPFKRFFRGWEIFRGHSVAQTHPAFLFGQTSTSGWWYYYLVAAFVKTPLPILFSFFLGVGYGVLSKRFFTPETVLLTIPPVFFLIVASLVNTVHIGLRHVLFIYPFLLVMAGGTVSLLARIKHPVLRLGSVGVLCVWLAGSSLFSFPNYLSYFNEIALLFGGKEQILAGSNISWGQDLLRLRDYVKKNRIPRINTLLYFNFPEELDYYKLPYIKNALGNLTLRRPGIYVIDIFNYQGLIRTPELKWLAKRKPNDRIGGSLLVYKL